MPRKLTQRETRLLKLGAAALAAYLALFYGLKGFAWLRDRRAEYDNFAALGEQISLQILKEQSKARLLASIRQSLGIDLDKLRENTVVGEARAAIRKAAQECQVGIGPTKEIPGGGREIATIQFDGQGAIGNLLKFLNRFGSIGYPVAIDRITLQTQGMKPGEVKFSLSAAVLGFKQWQKEGTTGA